MTKHTAHSGVVAKLRGRALPSTSTARCLIAYALFCSDLKRLASGIVTMAWFSAESAAARKAAGCEHPVQGYVWQGTSQVLSHTNTVCCHWFSEAFTAGTAEGQPHSIRAQVAQQHQPGKLTLSYACNWFKACCLMGCSQCTAVCLHAFVSALLLVSHFCKLEF